MDIGSTFIKYSVYDDSLKKTLFFSKTAFPSGDVEKDKTFTVSRKLIENKLSEIFKAVTSYNISKVFISVQMHGYIIKTANGSFSDYISWRDKSGETTQSKFKDIDFNLFGTSLKPNLPVTKIKECDEEKEFFTLGSYIVYVLTGINATHITDACASGFFYADTGAPNEFAKNIVMPKVYKHITKVGNYNSIAVYAPVGDHQASFLGSHAGDDSYLINIGTAAQVSCLSREGKYDNCEHRPYFSGKYKLYTVSGLIDETITDKNDSFFSRLVNAIKMLPPKKNIVFSGGGSKQLYPVLKKLFEEINVSCTQSGKEVGMEGLKMIAKQDILKCGTMLSEAAFPNFPIIAKKSGLDFLIIDNEHGAFDWSTLASLIMNANLISIDAIVRVGDASRATITKIADMGAKGFLLPMTSTKEEIRELVKYAKYSPTGKRGISTTRAHTLYSPKALDEYKREANEKMKIFAQIETKTGVENVFDIIQEEGVDGIFVGPNDLSDDFGVKPDSDEIKEAIKKISAAASSFGKVWGIITTNKNLINYSENCGAKLISYGSELNMLVSGCKKIVEELK